MKSYGELLPPEFLRVFHGEGPWPLVAINRETTDIKAADFPRSDAQERDALNWATKLNAAGYDLYFPINPLKQAIRRKGSKRDVLETRWQWIDCDPPTELSVHELQNWRADKLSEIRAGKNGVPAPTLIVDSGRGIWAFWRLRNPEPLDGHGPLTQRVEDVGRGLEKEFGADSCHNIERIARLPGFVNHKTGATARVLEFHAERDCVLEDLPSAPVQSRERSDAPVVGQDDLIDDDAARLAVRTFLTRDAPPAVQGERGRHTTMIVLQRCQDLGCNFETSCELMEEFWNETCVPPWRPGEIARTMRGLERGDPVGSAHPTLVARRLLANPPQLSVREIAAQGLAPQERFPLHFHGDPD
ncbi:MAG: hypothetical protein WAV18_32470, partial [Roseiarcus sp.]